MGATTRVICVAEFEFHTAWLTQAGDMAGSRSFQQQRLRVIVTAAAHCYCLCLFILKQLCGSCSPSIISVRNSTCTSYTSIDCLFIEPN